MIENTVANVRDEFAHLLVREEFVRDKAGGKLLELVGAAFRTTADYVFGLPNADYVARELAWYASMSLNVNDIPGGPPAIWKQVADSRGFINSNYGWCVFSDENGRQYARARDELMKNPQSRRAVMIYTRPEMWVDYDRDGRSDFMCTNAVQYFVRDEVLRAVVQMRSNDAWAGYRNDYAWQLYVGRKLAEELGLQFDPLMVWCAGSFHVYERDFYLVHHYVKTGIPFTTRQDYAYLYPDSPFGRTP